MRSLQASEDHEMRGDLPAQDAFQTLRMSWAGATSALPKRPFPRPGVWGVPGLETCSRFADCDTLEDSISFGVAGFFARVPGGT